MKRRTLLAGLLASPALSAATDLSWTDSARSRAVPLRLRLPEGSAPCPLVLFSHGLGGSLDAGTQWGEAWAQAGIATLHLQHPGSDSAVLREGMRAFRAAANGEQLLARCADVRFVLDELQRRAAEFPRLQLDRLGMAGHSFGSHTTLALAGQGYGRAGEQRLQEPRFKAFAAFSPSPGDARVAEPARSFGGVRRPVLCLTGSLDGDPLGAATNHDPERRDNGGWRRAVFDALPPGDKAELWLDGADHMTFSGQALRGLRRRRQRSHAASEQAERHRRLIEAVSSAWWRAQLLDDAAARAQLAQAPAGLLSQDAWRRG
jgi:predicted dienelactone hydrolase